MADRYTSRSGNEGRLPAWADWAGGGSLGVLLGLLIGLSASPVVNTVISALVALLAGLFGFSEKISLAVSAGPARRLIAFSLCAALVVPAGVYVRTHDVLAPSLERQKADLALIGYQEGTPQHAEMLRYLRYGLLPSGTAEAEKANWRQPVLYADLPDGFCAELTRLRTADELLVVFSQSATPFPEMAEKIGHLAPDAQASAAIFARMFLCNGE